MNSSSLRSRRVLPLAIALALGLPAAHAATITVTTGGDAGTASTCTLRQALDSANNDAAGSSSCVAGSGDDTVLFDDNLRNSTITLAGQPLQIASNVTLTGTNETINANNQSAVLYIDPAAITTLSYLTLTGGNSGDNPYAGAVNILSPQANKPAHAFAAAAAKRRSTPIAHAPQAGQGTSLSHVTITGNTSKYVGGLLVENGYASLYQCTVSNNTATGSAAFIGGGVVALGSAVLAYGSTISGNSVPNGDEQPTGGIGGYYALIALADTTVSGNSASGSDYVAGGVAQSSSDEGSAKYGVVTLNSTISGNSATGTGTNLSGGVVLGGATGYGAAYFVNSIVDGNTASRGTTRNVDVIGSSRVQAKYSLFGTELQATLSGNGNVFAADPKLGPLADNGGPTQTRALLAGSPAIDAGNNDAATNFQYDQRGPGFPRIVGPTVDIGAFEGGTASAGGALPVPALSTWGAALFAAVLALFGFAARRRRS
ncbi:MAG TPA: IPTL-CTERM sorting domain-containing protein [Rudaea sp.]|nr:IPTL-CTERM sorting domain-containing protein [Rudaea sp.]